MAKKHRAQTMTLAAIKKRMMSAELPNGAAVGCCGG